MTIQPLDSASRREADTSFREPSELQPLVQSLQSVLKQIDDEYERERDRLSQTLPDTEREGPCAGHAQGPSPGRRDNDVRELAAPVAQPQ